LWLHRSFIRDIHSALYGSGGLICGLAALCSGRAHQLDGGTAALGIARAAWARRLALGLLASSLGCAVCAVRGWLRLARSHWSKLYMRFGVRLSGRFRLCLGGWWSVLRLRAAVRRATPAGGRLGCGICGI
jgi:hypothetical protein